MTHLDYSSFFKLLRLSFRLSQEIPVDVGAEEWQQLYQTAVRQSLVGVSYQGLCLIPKDTKPPLDILIQWAALAENIRGLNMLMNQEASRLTQLFAEKGRRTVILKGQANARLYPDKLSRQPGDIDIWVEGGQESVIALLQKMGMVDKLGKILTENTSTKSYHHVHLQANEQGVDVEVHFRPSSGNHNPFTNRRLQRWLEQEIHLSKQIDEGFCVPSLSFSLMMQLAHIRRHFFGSGIGLRQVCDYYWLLRHSSAEERQEVLPLLSKFGLRHIAGAVMWVLGEVLNLNERFMLCAPDSTRGEWLLREMMTDGNFGQYSEWRQQRVWLRIIRGKLRSLRLMRFDFWEMFWLEIDFWKIVIQTLPTRIKYRTISLTNLK